ncbi:MAG: 2-amino-4-hydroxy-6-hydroxymethyldihydropteridine diphosphokinase [Halocynthiibacter sp.]|jgi:2-amino-4-hydroxy-6-hydroxymethyldihydropteridine diphosphokinase
MSQGESDANLCQRALIALGANIRSMAGPPEQTIAAAVEMLREGGLEIEALSPLYATPCVPAGAGPDYVNGALSIQCDLGPEALLARLHAVEAAFGRVRGARWQARELDLDLIAYGDAVCPDATTWQYWASLPFEAQVKQAPKGLILPHPRLAERAFVVIPLAQIAPDWVHPILGKSLREMADALPVGEKNALKPLDPV